MCAKKIDFFFESVYNKYYGGMHEMNIMILTVSAGQGHHATGRAITEYFESKGHTTKTVDVYEYISPIISKSIEKGYLVSTKYTKKAYRQFYRKAETVTRPTFSYATNRAFGKLFRSCIKDFMPDAIICTHVWAAQFIDSYINKYGAGKMITVGVVTDFVLHPYWERTKVDYLITASELLNRSIQKKNIPLEKVRAFGIPIRNQFSTPLSRKEACQKLGIPDKTTILIMSGSMGYGNVARHILALDSLDQDFQILAVCGRNKHLQHSLEKLDLKKDLFVYGYTDEVHVMMDAASCIVTKPGGLSVSESLAKGLPMILMNPIPGQEDRNLDFMLNNGLAQYVTKLHPLDEAVFQLFSSPDLLENRRRVAQAFGKPNATQDLCEFIIEVHNERKANGS